MAVVDAKELKKQRTGTRKEKGVREYVRIFHVLTDTEADGPAIVLAYPSIPRIKDPYASGNDADPISFCKSITVTVGDDGFLWTVECQYSSETTGEEENPLLKPPVYTWSFAQFQRAVEKDVEGKKITNSAGQYFDPPVEIDDSRPVLTVEKNQLFFSSSQAIQYQDAVNSDPFIGFDPGQAKVANISAKEAIYQGTKYWECGYEFHFRREGWKKEILDQGRMQLGINNKLKPCTDDSGKEVSDPVLLDGSGAQLATNGTPVYLPFKVYKELSFGVFGIS